jgi:hypothetical protein
LYHSEHSWRIIGSLSVEVEPNITSASVAFDRLKQTTVTLLKGVTEVLPLKTEPRLRR